VSERAQDAFVRMPQRDQSPKGPAEGLTSWNPYTGALTPSPHLQYLITSRGVLAYPGAEVRRFCRTPKRFPHPPNLLSLVNE
jgi:hypothetical protein